MKIKALLVTWYTLLPIVLPSYALLPFPENCPFPHELESRWTFLIFDFFLVTCRHAVLFSFGRLGQRMKKLTKALIIIIVYYSNKWYYLTGKPIGKKTKRKKLKKGDKGTKG